MFKFLVKKGLYNLVLSSYDSCFFIYKDEVSKFVFSMTDETTEKEMITGNFRANQKYYETVFDDVCQKISENVPKFKHTLPFNLTIFDFNPDKLAAGTIYDFVWYCLTGKRADSKKCISINHYVNDLRNQYLLELNEKVKNK